MFKRSFAAQKEQRGVKKISKRSFNDDAKQRIREKLAAQTITPDSSPSIGGGSPALNSSIITIVVGKEQRLFAAHDEVLCRSPWFANVLRDHFFDSQKRLILSDEDPTVFSHVLEYLYKGDYHPLLIHDQKRDTWKLEDMPDDVTMTPRSVRTQKSFVGFNESATMYDPGVGGYILRDTALYCAAGHYGLPALQRLAIRKQGLTTGIDVVTILNSARYAYEHTLESDSKLRAHFLALIIRSRRTFKKSGTMQNEMAKGGTPMFFDLFVAMCHHIDDLEAGHGRSPVVTKV